jgi:hypothetical protein
MLMLTRTQSNIGRGQIDHSAARKRSLWCDGDPRLMRETLSPVYQGAHNHGLL